MSKISARENGVRKTMNHLKGRLPGPLVEEVRSFCGHLLDGGGTLTFDLEDVSFPDFGGAAFLNQLFRQNFAPSNGALMSSNLFRRVQ